MEAQYMPSSKWPADIDSDAFYGLAGDIIKTIYPHSEADKNGLLIQLMVATGNAIGGSPYYQVESTRHHVNLFTVIVGDTAKARKGTSWGWIKKIITMADEHWNQCLASGMSSGEGIIYQARDDEDNPEPTKRLMIVEGEFAQALKVARREGNTLSPVLRNAWDGGVLRTLTRNSPMISTDSHISVVGHITQEELLRHLGEIDMANGLGNRFLWCCVRRSKLLPHGGDLDDCELIPLAQRLREVFAHARKGGVVVMDEDARAAWERIYKHMATTSEAGLIGAMTARMEAQTVRLATLYALLDESFTINYDHLTAAKALTNYCQRSVKHIFCSVTGNPIADTILRALEDKPKISRTGIRNMGGRHWRKHDIDEAISLLIEEYGVVRYNEPTDGRPITWLMQELPDYMSATKAT